MSEVATISQALRRIKEIKGKLSTLAERMGESISWVEPVKPIYDFHQLKNQRTALVQELVILKDRLIRTNAATLIRGKSLQHAIFQMAELKAEKAVTEGLHLKEGTSKRIVGYHPQTQLPIVEETKVVSAMKEVERDLQVEALETMISELNTEIEDANHRTTLLV